MKISIPKQALSQIMSDYNCSEETAANAFLNAQDSANQAYKESLEERFATAPSIPDTLVPKRYTPREIKRYLDDFIIGQEEYKKRLAIAAAYHFAMIKYLGENPEDRRVKRFRKKNTITAGPSGSGKTYCVEVLGDLLQVPTLIIDATDYTEAGYVGKSADDMIRELIDLAPGKDHEQQARFVNQYGGLICIDEIDKKAKENGLSGHDISREGFQRSVLKLIERKLVPIHNPYSAAAQLQEVIDNRKGRKTDPHENMISTENILFILGGSFERSHNNLEAIVKKRLQHKGRVQDDGSVEILGFTPDKGNGRGRLQNYYKEAQADDFINFGLLPELIGRSPIKTFVNLLSKNDLTRIMLDTEDSILNQYKMEFRLFNIAMEFTLDAVEYVAEISENRKTGARTLVSVWENILTDFQFELPGSNFSRIEVTRRLCEHPKDVLLEMLEKSPFVDFIENFKTEYGIELIMGEAVQQFVEEYAAQHKMPVSQSLKTLLLSASALNYMGIRDPFEITLEMVQDKNYFDTLFTQWYQNQNTADGDSLEGFNKADSPERLAPEGGP